MQRHIYNAISNGEIAPVQIAASETTAKSKSLERKRPAGTPKNRRGALRTDGMKTTAGSTPNIGMPLPRGVPNSQNIRCLPSAAAHGQYPSGDDEGGHGDPG